MTGVVKYINVDGRSYCVVNHGNKKHSEALEYCKKLNSKLPLPRTKAELDKFRKISPSWTHVDARNPLKTSNKTEWVDAEGKPLGNRPVYLMGHKSKHKIKLLILCKKLISQDILIHTLNFDF